MFYSILVLQVQSISWLLWGGCPTSRWVSFSKILRRFSSKFDAAFGFNAVKFIRQGVEKVLFVFETEVGVDHGADTGCVVLLRGSWVPLLVGSLEDRPLLGGASFRDVSLFLTFEASVFCV